MILTEAIEVREAYGELGATRQVFDVSCQPQKGHELASHLITQVAEEVQGEPNLIVAQRMHLINGMPPVGIVSLEAEANLVREFSRGAVANWGAYLTSQNGEVDGRTEGNFSYDAVSGVYAMTDMARGFDGDPESRFHERAKSVDPQSGLGIILNTYLIVTRNKRPTEIVLMLRPFIGKCLEYLEGEGQDQKSEFLSLIGYSSPTIPEAFITGMYLANEYMLARIKATEGVMNGMTHVQYSGLQPVR